jgi:hypothetical protein
MEDLQKRLEELKRRAQRVADIQNVEKLFNTYLQYYALQHKEGVLGTFALDQPDVSVEEAYSEVFEGAQAVEDYYDFMTRLARKPGILLEQQAVCPVIEIAGDGKTAKIVCFSRGVKGVAQTKVQSFMAGKYYVDFIKQPDGEWKIWHMQWFMIFDSDMKKGFMYHQTWNGEEWNHPELEDVFTAKQNKPSTYWPNVFNPNIPCDYIPEAPEPFETYDGMTALKRTRILQHYWDPSRVK